MANTLQKESILTLCEEVAQPGQLRVVSPGTTIIASGDTVKYLYVIKSGIFKLGIEYNNLYLTIEYLFSGSIAGLVNLHKGINYPFQIKAVTESSIYVWERSKILELMDIMPEFTDEIRENYSEWGVRVFNRMKSLVFLAPYQRVASWVYDYCKFKVYKQNNVWAALTIADMAEFCKVGEVEFETALQELVKSNVVSISKDDCVVNNWDKLNFIINTPS